MAFMGRLSSSATFRHCFRSFCRTEVVHRSLVTQPALEGRKTDLVIFDKNGTLIDFDAAWTPWVIDLNRNISNNMGKALGDKVFHALGFDVIGRSWKLGIMMSNDDQIKESITKVLVCQGATEGEAVDLVEKSYVPCDFTNPDFIKPIDHPRAMIQTLTDYGVKVAIATTDNRLATEMVIDDLDLWPLLSASICCGDDPGSASKPDPVNIQILCDTVGVPPERTVMVGDATVDIQMGKQAGCQMSIGVMSGVGLRPELESARPNHIVPSTVDVLPYVLPDGFLHIYTKHVTTYPVTSSDYAQAWHASQSTNNPHHVSHSGFNR